MSVLHGDGAISDRRLRELSDIEEIRNLVARYAHHLLHGEGDAMADLFAEDGCFIASNGTHIIGRDAIKARHKTMQAGGVVPVMGGLAITLMGATATGTCTMYTPTSRKQGEAGGPFYGEYKDRFVWVNSGWLFQERNFTYYS
jgi:ketosteroid isomerase-like protein